MSSTEKTLNRHQPGVYGIPDKGSTYWYFLDGMANGKLHMAAVTQPLQTRAL
ncbi:hypothetical protein [Dictyobacter aurantiacus]|uniref:hypothetical protein n=1 Tax=Dictyobacter aurantiacus TaxID=1936993 RepID=UPI001356E129|nr:hypothetical protein [Dictyobacter aurantiacus]